MHVCAHLLCCCSDYYRDYYGGGGGGYGGYGGYDSRGYGGGYDSRGSGYERRCELAHGHRRLRPSPTLQCLHVAAPCFSCDYPALGSIISHASW